MSMQPNPSGWTFLSNHSHVPVCLAADGDQTLHEDAAKAGATCSISSTKRTAG
jgi:hypothetical protein